MGAAEIISKEYLENIIKKKEIINLEWRWGAVRFGLVRGIKKKYKTYNDFVCCNKKIIGVV